MRARLTGLVLGARFAVSGGRGGWTRAAMTALGVGLGVALLLVAASTPAILANRAARGEGRAVAIQPDVPRSDSTVLVAELSGQYRSELIYGWAVRAEGDHPALPPGVSRLPGPGEIVVSKALRRLLASDEGALLRPRFPYTIVGTIADRGVLGPNELAFYLGDSSLSSGGAQRIDHFGDTPDHQPLNPILLLLIIIGFVVMLVPVAVFVGAAVRFGGDGRDRRLAALRLVGADRAMARWISAGEALAGSVLGVLVGGALLLAFRGLVEHVTVWDFSVYAGDVSPSPVLAALIVVAVPLLAVVVTLLALRRVSIEPLGVVRRGGGARRRVWWRLLIPVAGLVVLLPAVREMRGSHSDPSVYPVAAGVTLLLVGVTTLLPWLVEATVRRLRGGSVSWQLATRRIQLDGGTAARLVSGIAVAVAGGIGLQMLFAGVQGGFRMDTGQQTDRYQVVVDANGGDALSGAALRAVPGVTNAVVFTQTSQAPAGRPEDGSGLIVADCVTLSQLAAIGDCADGDVFLVSLSAEDVAHRGDTQVKLPVPGASVQVGNAGTPVPGQDVGAGLPWTVPAGARPAQALRSVDGGLYPGVYATPAAMHGLALGRNVSIAYLAVVPGDPDTIERIRNAAFLQGPRTQVWELRTSRTDDKFAKVERGLFLGVVAVLLLIGASLLVSMVEQLAERRRLLAMLVAVGTRRSVLGWSVLWQAAIPVLLGLALALGVGLSLGVILLAMVNTGFGIDWLGILGIVGVAALVVLLVTGLAMPVLYRLMRTTGLRTE